jgi:Fic family protein
MSLILKVNKIREAMSGRLASRNLVTAEEENQEIIKLSISRKHFYQNFRENFSYNSNAIEGNKVTLPETYEILRKHVTVASKPLKDQMEIIGHAKAFDYLVQTATDKRIPLSRELILTVHKMIFEDDNPIAGRFRQFGEGVVVGNPVTGEIFHQGVNPIAVEDNIGGLIDDYNDFSEDKSLNKIALLAGFHMCFEDIHPFNDGNGRTGRLLVNFELIKHGYLPIDIKFANRDSYYRAFNNPDNYGYMTELFSQAMIDTTVIYRQLHDDFIKGNIDKAPIFQADTFPTPKIISDNKEMLKEMLWTAEKENQNAVAAKMKMSDLPDSLTTENIKNKNIGDRGE